MKLYLAISGESKDGILEKLKLALECKEFTKHDANGYLPSNAEGVSLDLDYEWVDESGDAMLADLCDCDEDFGVTYR